MGQGSGQQASPGQGRTGDKKIRQHRVIKIYFTPSRSFMVASLRLSFPMMEAACSHCRRLVGYSLPLRECFTLELVMRITRPGSARGTGVASRDLSQTTKKYMIDNGECKYVAFSLPLKTFCQNMSKG